MSGSDERGLGKDRVEVSGFSTKALDHAFSELRGGENVVDFDEKEFSLELISHMNDRMGEPFNFPYSKLLNSQPRFNIKKFKGMNTEEYLKICSQYIVTYRDKRGELCMQEPGSLQVGLYRPVQMPVEARSVFEVDGFRTSPECRRSACKGAF